MMSDQKQTTPYLCGQTKFRAPTFTTPPTTRHVTSTTNVPVPTRWQIIQTEYKISLKHCMGIKSINYLDMSLYSARLRSKYDTHGPLQKKKTEDNWVHCDLGKSRNYLKLKMCAEYEK